MRFTTLIPAYKPKYMIELLSSIRHQTVKPEKIIVSDDSPDQAFLHALKSEPIYSLIADLNIQVVQGPRNGAWNNFKHLLQLFLQQSDVTSDFFHIMLDDDILYPNFYEQHKAVHERPDVSCVISRRWSALESGQPVRDNLPVPKAIAEHDHRVVMLDADLLFNHTAGTSTNWLGEFSNTTFKAALASEIQDINLAGISYSGLEDLGSFLKASLHGKVGYINTHLGCFRMSNEQHSANPMGRPLKLAFLAYASLAIASRNLGYITSAQTEDALQKVSDFVLTHYSEEVDMQEICECLPRLGRGGIEAEGVFLRKWERFATG